MPLDHARVEVALLQGGTLVLCGGGGGGGGAPHGSTPTFEVKKMPLSTLEGCLRIVVGEQARFGTPAAHAAAGGGEPHTASLPAPVARTPPAADASDGADTDPIAAAAAEALRVVKPKLEGQAAARGDGDGELVAVVAAALAHAAELAHGAVRPVGDEPPGGAGPVPTPEALIEALDRERCQRRELQRSEHALRHKLEDALAARETAIIAMSRRASSTPPPPPPPPPPPSPASSLLLNLLLLLLLLPPLRPVCLRALSCPSPPPPPSPHPHRPHPHPSYPPTPSSSLRTCPPRPQARGHGGTLPLERQVTRPHVAAARPAAAARAARPLQRRA